VSERDTHDAGNEDGPDPGGFRASWSLLRRNPEFRRLFLASLISLGGDWFLFVAIASLVLEATDSAVLVGMTILSQELALFCASPLGGVLADRIDRQRLMIGCDVVRVVICLGFLAVGDETVWLAFPLLALLAIFAAPFDPASSAAIPNLVASDDLPTANALGGSLWGTMLAVGAALGGVVSAIFGRDTAFLVDAASFAASAVLLAGIRGSFMERNASEHEHPSVVEATRETMRYARQDHRVLALLGVKAGFGLAAGVLALIPLFAERVFHSGEVGFGLLMACRGMGALIGPFLGNRLAGPGHRRLYSVIGCALAVFGLGYVLLGLTPSIWLAAVTILFAHLGGGTQWVLSTYGLQVIVPDRIRGRIFGFDFAFITLSLALSSLGASWLAGEIGPRRAGFIMGGVALTWAGTWWVLTRKVRRTSPFGGPDVVRERNPGGPLGSIESAAPPSP
jgi:predicted MFS family arabinose efflux permease